MSQSHNPGHNPTGRKTPAKWVRLEPSIAFDLYDSAPHGDPFEWFDTELDEAVWRRHHRRARYHDCIEVAVAASQRDCKRNKWRLTDGFLAAVEDRRARDREGWCESTECSARSITHEKNMPVCGVCGAPIRGDEA
jgi:hypothetical protein